MTTHLIPPWNGYIEATVEEISLFSNSSSAATILCPTGSDGADPERVRQARGGTRGLLSGWPTPPPGLSLLDPAGGRAGGRDDWQVCPGPTQLPGFHRKWIVVPSTCLSAIVWARVVCVAILLPTLRHALFSLCVTVFVFEDSVFCHSSIFPPHSRRADKTDKGRQRRKSFTHRPGSPFLVFKLNGLVAIVHVPTGTILNRRNNANDLMGFVIFSNYFFQCFFSQRTLVFLISAQFCCVQNNYFP